MPFTARTYATGCTQSGRGRRAMHRREPQTFAAPDGIGIICTGLAVARRGFCLAKILGCFLSSIPWDLSARRFCWDWRAGSHGVREYAPLIETPLIETHSIGAHSSVRMHCRNGGLSNCLEECIRAANTLTALSMGIYRGVRKIIARASATWRVDIR